MKTTIGVIALIVAVLLAGGLEMGREITIIKFSILFFCVLCSILFLIVPHFRNDSRKYARLEPKVLDSKKLRIVYRPKGRAQ